MTQTLEISNKGLELIASAEGLSLVAYLCPAGIPTIGYGHTGSDVTKADVGVKTITREEALQLLRMDVKSAAKAVLTAVKVPLTQGQFDALVSFVYNVGAGNFRSSTLLKLLNAGDYAGAAAQFGRWNKSGGKALPGLTRRREAEQQLFLGTANTDTGDNAGAKTGA